MTVREQHACARAIAGGKVVCWGANDFAQLGNGGSGNGPVEPMGQP